MITVKTDDAEVFDAAAMLKKANESLAAAKKEADAAKEIMTRWLEQNRKIVVADLPIGEVVNIAGACLVTVDKQHRLDSARLRQVKPDVVEEFSGDFAVVKWKPV